MDKDIKTETSERSSKEEENVEKIAVNKRTATVKVQYPLKSISYEEEDSTSEPEENLDYEESIKAFEDKRKEKEAKAKKSEPGQPKIVSDRNCDSGDDTSTTSRKGSGTSVSSMEDGKESKKEKKENMSIYGFEKGLIVEKIIGATDVTGELIFLVKWANSDKADLVPAKVAHVMCPQQVIAFYEKRLNWRPRTHSE